MDNLYIYIIYSLFIALYFVLFEMLPTVLTNIISIIYLCVLFGYASCKQWTGGFVVGHSLFSE